jgi:predicted acetyltransferase
VAHLELPSAAWQVSFLDALAEYHQEGRYLIFDPAELRRDFSGFVARLTAYAHGQGLPADFVPMSDFWLIDHGEFIGRVSLRHRLNESLTKLGGHIGYDIRPSKRRQGYGTQILALALPKARELGLERALVTCDETNVASRKIIEANGGVLENVVEMAEGEPRVCRYWIKL